MPNESSDKQEKKAKKDKQKQSERPGFIGREAQKAIGAVLLFCFSLILFLSFFGLAGSAGVFLYDLMKTLFGFGAFLVPIGFIFAGMALIKARNEHFYVSTTIGLILFLVSILGCFHLFGQGYKANNGMAGGWLGYLAGAPLEMLFGFWGGLVILFGFLFVSFIVGFNMSLKKIFSWLGNARPADNDNLDMNVSGIATDLTIKVPQEESTFSAIKRFISQQKFDFGKSEKTEKSKEGVGDKKETELIINGAEVIKDGKSEKSEVAGTSSIKQKKHVSGDLFKKPPVDFLENDKGKSVTGDIKANANIIRRTLQNFGIEVEMAEVNIGPTVTQYTFRPAQGVKLSRITTLQDDLSLALAAHPIRIEAPIPGRSLVGIELPNKSVSTVCLKSLISDMRFQNDPSLLTVALGRDVAGEPVYAALDKMPHMLIAGATGSGKSIGLNTLIVSLLYKNTPSTLRLIMVDPKRVEFPLYNNIPHLLTPVIVEPEKTLNALKWAVGEMERRFSVMSDVAKDIRGYNEKKPEEPMPYIAIIIDELADLMMAHGREVETYIVRLAQMARAVGIHLVLATQRPSVEVITGLIKANITTRSAFQVASQIDSRTILDTSGAEKLLGKGDMLFLSADAAKPRRVQGAYIGEKEINQVTAFLREQGEPEYVDEIVNSGKSNFSGGVAGNDRDVFDPKFDEAKKIVIETGKASASYLQRRMGVGYSRAARLIDMLEEDGVVGPADGAKPREILISQNVEF